MTHRTYSGPRLRRLGARISAPVSRVSRSGPHAVRGSAWLQLADLLHDTSPLDPRERHVRERITENARSVLPLLGQHRDEVLRQVAAARHQHGATAEVTLILALAQREADAS